MGAGGAADDESGSQDAMGPVGAAARAVAAGLTALSEMSKQGSRDQAACIRFAEMKTRMSYAECGTIRNSLRALALPKKLLESK